MDKYLEQNSFSGNYDIKICGSKSESNRLLILKKLYPKINIGNLSTSDDTVVLSRSLQSNSDLIDVHHAGTAMRFLTAYYACFTETVLTLTGSERMQNRPISLLVQALKDIGAKIEYIDKEGYPPIKIFPSKINKSQVELRANVSSQYISALMLVAPKLNKGLQINLNSEITSLPYLKMTEKLMTGLGFQVNYEDKSISIISKSNLDYQSFDVESDWSSASYFYSLVALNPDLSLRLSTYKDDSLQGDSDLFQLYEPLGVVTSFNKNSILLQNSKRKVTSAYKKDLNDNPDLAQTIAVTCLGLGIPCKLEGLHTLKIKETDRLTALKMEIEKLGAEVSIGEDWLEMKPATKLKSQQAIETYNDHRMAMAFAPIMSKTTLTIKDADVVSKSYPKFWLDLSNIQDQK